MRIPSLIGVMILFVVITPTLLGQSYKRWFLAGPDNQKSCVGMTTLPAYNDTLLPATAFWDACIRYVANVSGQYHIRKGFSKSEAGSMADYSLPVLKFDTAMAAMYASYFVILDSMRTTNVYAVLAGPRETALSADLFEMVCPDSISEPEWIKTFPRAENYYYGVGISEQFYSEISSWNAAEHSALSAIASQISSQIKAVERKDTGIEGLATEEAIVGLHHIVPCGRWKDPRKLLFYVLLKMPK
jgi:hypothetical protein